MKNCPTCKIEYIDETLEFCLEDGSKLVSTENVISTGTKTAVLNEFPDSVPKNFDVSKETILINKETDKLTHIKEKVTYQSNKVIETAPIVIALIHNYWQWLYLNKASYGSVVDFLTSGQFSIWFSLLIVGIITGFVALKFGKYKGLAITGLVILAINLLLSIVPIK